MTIILRYAFWFFLSRTKSFKLYLPLNSWGLISRARCWLRSSFDQGRSRHGTALVALLGIPYLVLVDVEGILLESS